MAERLTLKILRVRQEGPRARTLYFETTLSVLPGRFVMVSDFQGGEKPISVSEAEGGILGITVKEAGSFTRRLCGKNPGDLITLRGAYGSAFTLLPGKVLLVGGGCGIAPLHLLSRALLDAGSRVVVVNGARTQDDILFGDRFSKLPLEYHETAEDSGQGLTSVEAARRILEKTPFDHVYAAGPELMLANLRPHLAKLPYQFLMERYMKCGVGICGSCA